MRVQPGVTYRNFGSACKEELRPKSTISGGVYRQATSTIRTEGSEELSFERFTSFGQRPDNLMD
jgi:hypothetical protein